MNLTLWRAAFDLVPPSGDYDVCINIHDVYQLATTPARKPDPRLWGAVHSYIHMLVQLIIGFFLPISVNLEPHMYIPIQTHTRTK